MRIWSNGAMLNLFINRSLEQMLVKWNVLIFSKGFLMCFFYKIKLHIEQKVHYIAVLDEVILAFGSEFSRRAALCLTA